MELSTDFHYSTERSEAVRLDSQGPHAITKAWLTTDEVVFEPRDVIRFLASHSIKLENPYAFTLQAEGQALVAELLEVILSNWIDFLFVPEPQWFAIYADHDEYTTLYLPTGEALVESVERLQVAGFKVVKDYTRDCSGYRWR